MGDRPRGAFGFDANVGRRGSRRAPTRATSLPFFRCDGHTGGCRPIRSRPMRYGAQSRRGWYTCGLAPGMARCAASLSHRWNASGGNSKWQSARNSTGRWSTSRRRTASRASPGNGDSPLERRLTRTIAALALRRLRATRWHLGSFRDQVLRSLPGQRLDASASARLKTVRIRHVGIGRIELGLDSVVVEHGRTIPLPPRRTRDGRFNSGR